MVAGDAAARKYEINVAVVPLSAGILIGRSAFVQCTKSGGNDRTNEMLDPSIGIIELQRDRRRLIHWIIPSGRDGYL